MIAECRFLQALKILRQTSADGSFREVNQKTLGWVYLNLMELYLDLERHVKAATYLGKWKALDYVEPRWLHERAILLEKRLDEFRDGVFAYVLNGRLRSLKEQEGDMKEKYRAWRAQQTALSLVSDRPNEIAKELDVSTTTVSRALRRYAKSPSKRGRKPSRDL